MSADNVLLSAYDAKRCARRVHNEWDPNLEKVAWDVPDDVRMRMDLGIEFEAGVFDELRAALTPSRYVDLSALRGKEAIVSATLEAMDAGVPLIMGGWLPDSSGRKGRPDLLVAVDGGYVPGDVKAHKMTAARTKGALTYSLPAAPAERRTVEGLGAQTTPRLDDYLQLAHYWRMLESIGRTPSGAATGFIVGTDELDVAGGKVLTWLDLDAPVFQTYSRSRDTAKRSALARHDHEHAFRVKVAQAAAAGEAALVQPIFTPECDSCPWLDHCLSITGEDAASARITSGRLSVREWAALADAGVVSVEDLAALDPADESFATAYLPEVTHVHDPLARLETAVRRARMLRDGIAIERETTGDIDLPAADVEIDFDIEWDPDDRVYLWGALVTRAGAEPTYHAVVSWDDLDDDAATALAHEFADWLRAELAAAAVAGLSVLVWHYAKPEPTYLRRVLGADNVADLTEHFVDLLEVVRAHYFGVAGLGIKKVAPAFGFEWRDEDPGGLQSQLWLIAARESQDAAARKRILAYNEDDVRATAAVRAGMRGSLQG